MYNDWVIVRATSRNPRLFISDLRCDRQRRVLITEGALPRPTVVASNLEAGTMTNGSQPMPRRTCYMRTQFKYVVCLDKALSFRNFSRLT